MCINIVDISVIIPTYKPQNYLWNCLKSLSKQSLSKEKYEVIIVLNGCKEPYESAISSYIYHNELTNFNLYSIIEGGVSNARNVGISYAKGEYVCFVDDDDLISYHFLENLLSKANRDTLVVSDFRTFMNDDMNNLGLDYVTYAFQNTKKDDVFSRRSFLSSCCGKLIHKNMIGNRLFPLELKNSEDAVFMFMISNKIKRIVLSKNNTIYFRRIRTLSASRINVKLNDRFFLMFLSMKMYTKIYFKSPFSYNFLLYLSRMVAACIYYLRIGK